VQGIKRRGPKFASRKGHGGGIKGKSGTAQSPKILPRPKYIGGLWGLVRTADTSRTVKTQPGNLWGDKEEIIRKGRQFEEKQISSTT